MRRFIFWNSLQLGVGDEGSTLDNVTLQFRNSSIKELLLIVRELANSLDLLDTILAKLNLGREVSDVVTNKLLNGLATLRVGIQVHIGAFNNTRLAIDGIQDSQCETSTSKGHGQGCRTGTSLGLDNLITTELNAIGDLLNLLLRKLLSASDLGEKRKNGDTAVTSNNGDLEFSGLSTNQFRNKGGGTDNVESGNTKDSKDKER